MRDLGRLTGITPEETEKLRRHGITEIHLLWAHIGRDFDGGIDEMARTAGIDRTRLIELLALEAECEAKKAETRGLKRFWPEAVLALSLLILILLLLRAVGVLEFLPRSLALPTKVLLAARDLESGHQLRSGDLTLGRATEGEDYFQSIDEVRGLILSNGVSRYRPLRFEDVLRVQVVATKDILPGAILTPDAIGLTWCRYDPDAVVGLPQALGYSAVRSIRSGDVILSESLKYLPLPTN